TAAAPSFVRSFLRTKKRPFICSCSLASTAARAGWRMQHFEIGAQSTTKRPKPVRQFEGSAAIFFDSCGECDGCMAPERRGLPTRNSVAVLLLGCPQHRFCSD